MSGEKYIKFITLAGAIFILAGSCYLFTYYQVFGINIFQYIKFDEVLNLIGQGAIVSGVMALILIIIRTFLAMLEFIAFGIKHRKSFREKERIDFEIYISRNKSNFNFFASILAFIAFIISTWRLNNCDRTTFFDFVGFTIFPVIFILIFSHLFEQARELKDEQEKLPSLKREILATIYLIPDFISVQEIKFISKSVCLILIFSTYGFYKARKIQSGIEHTRVEIKFDEILVKSSADLLYIGKSNDFYFFYDVRKDHPVIYSSDLKKKVIEE